MIALFMVIAPGIFLRFYTLRSVKGGVAAAYAVAGSATADFNLDRSGPHYLRSADDVGDFSILALVHILWTDRHRKSRARTHAVARRV